MPKVLCSYWESLIESLNQSYWRNEVLLAYIKHTKRFHPETLKIQGILRINCSCKQGNFKALWPLLEPGCVLHLEVCLCANVGSLM